MHPGGDGTSAAVPDGFIAGPENHLVELMVCRVLEGNTSEYFPIVVCGPSGVGKTHLARGIVARCKASLSNGQAVYVTAVDFARQLADAIETQTVDDFAKRCRTTPLFVLEDLQFLAGKLAAQTELVYTLDALRDAAACALVTCRLAPAALTGFLPGLKSRLVGGLSVPVLPPGREARLALLQRTTRLPGDAAELLADALHGPAPELFGAVNELLLSSDIEGRTIDVAAVRRFLDRRHHPEPSIHRIALLAAKRFSVTLRDLRGSTRRRGVVAARGVAMYLARDLTGRSLREIGRYFGRRDHTTVSHGCRRVEALLQSDASLRYTVFQLQEELTGEETA